MDSLKLDELVGSLQTFETTLKSPRKSKRHYVIERLSKKKGNESHASDME